MKLMDIGKRMENEHITTRFVLFVVRILYFERRR